MKETGPEDHRASWNWSEANVTQYSKDMVFNDGHKLSIIVYCTLMIFSAVGNITVLVMILKRRKKQSTRVNTMLMHLAIADLMVTFLLMPLEIVWAITVQWLAGDFMCRIMMFFRIFGLYLSSFILICISLDRYYAVLKPLKFTGANKLCKWMIITAWVAATLCSTPQIIIFHVESHPRVPNYFQCVTYNIFSNKIYELIHLHSSMFFMYTLPLLVIMFSYSCILFEIIRRTRTSGPDIIRRSSMGYFGKAKIRTLKMTVVIVMVFFICWTPYWIMSVWFWHDEDTAANVDLKIQKGLYLFACTNSCMNPIVYGLFSIKHRRTTNQSADLNNSHNRSIRMGSEVVCLVSWKKKSTNTPKQSRRDVCLNCGESYEYPTTGGGSRMYAMNGKYQKNKCCCTNDFKSEVTCSDSSL